MSLFKGCQAFVGDMKLDNYRCENIDKPYDSNGRIVNNTCLYDTQSQNCLGFRTIMVGVNSSSCRDRILFDRIKLKLMR